MWPYKSYLDLLYSNSMWRQSSIPTSILMEELSSGYVLSVCTTMSVSLLMSFSRLITVARRKYLQTKREQKQLFPRYHIETIQHILQGKSGQG